MTHFNFSWFLGAQLPLSQSPLSIATIFFLLLGKSMSGTTFVPSHSLPSPLSPPEQKQNNSENLSDKGRKTDVLSLTSSSLSSSSSSSLISCLLFPSLLTQMWDILSRSHWFPTAMRETRLTDSVQRLVHVYLGAARHLKNSTWTKFVACGATTSN